MSYQPQPMFKADMKMTAYCPAMFNNAHNGPDSINKYNNKSFENLL